MRKLQLVMLIVGVPFLYCVSTSLLAAIATYVIVLFSPCTAVMMQLSAMMSNVSQCLFSEVVM